MVRLQAWLGAMMTLLGIAGPGAFGQRTAVAPAESRETVRPAFDVASIKPYAPGSSPGVVSWTGNNAAGLHEISNLEFFIEQAYHIQPLQLSGAPGWIESEFFEITAKTDKPTSPAERDAMLQTLLAERFKLALHMETRDLPVYSLVVAKGGPKMVAPDPGTPFSFAGGRTLLRGVMETGDIARQLTAAVGRKVIDNSGLRGPYKVDLTWAASDGDSGPSIFTAVQEQLGLKLEPAKAPVEMYVVDHVERPSPN